MPTGSADRDESIAFTSEVGIRNHYAFPEQVQFDGGATANSPSSRWKALGASEREAAT